MVFDYKQYFETIKPKTKMDIYNRFLFAFCSVHTTWRMNIKGYLLLRNKFHTKLRSIKELIQKSGMGLTNHRADYIVEFTEAFMKDYKFYLKKETETWKGYATRLQINIKGLGFAKSRFAIELIYPNEAEIVCVDTHVIQWAKQNPNKMNKRLSEKIEDGFINHSKQQGINPVEARWKFWDKKQGFDNPRYWSFVLEETK